MRISNFKIGFTEADIRKADYGEVVYLDPTQSYPVPDITKRFHTGFHWKKNHESLKIAIENQGHQKTRTGGGLAPKVKDIKRAIVLGSGQKSLMLKDKKDWTVFGVGESLAQGPDLLDYYVCNHPSEECLKWAPKEVRRWPRGIFGYGTYPKFVKQFGGVKFFYGSGWESEAASLYLIDLMDPLSVTLSLLGTTNCQTITLANCVFGKREESPGMVKVGETYLYPGQIMSLSMLSAMIFWLRRDGRTIYTLDEGLPSDTPSSVKNLFEEV